jgi:hypothetical protein
VFTLGVLALIAGCHTGSQSNGAALLGRISRGGHSAALKPGDLADRGRAEITDECEKQSYETAKKGLIVSETGMHEDVFTLRDRISYGAIGYGLDEALRLESLLRAEAKVGGHSPEQAACIQKFAEHLETVSDPLIEQDERLKELDASAFKNSTKEAEEEAERQLRETEKMAQPKGPLNQDY